MPMSAPDSTVAISLSLSVRTPAPCPGGQFVVANGGETVAELRMLDRARDAHRHARQYQHHQEQVLDIAAVKERRRRRPDDVDAAGTADIIPVGEKRLPPGRVSETPREPPT